MVTLARIVAVVGALLSSSAYSGGLAHAAASAAEGAATAGDLAQGTGDTPVPGGTAQGEAPAASVPAGATGTPAAVIERFHAAIIAMLPEAEGLGYEGRFRRLSPAVEAAFELPYMAEKAIGRHWKALGATERDRWLATFAQFTKANYAGRFDRRSDVHFRTLGSEPAAHGTVIVRTELLNPEGENVHLNYRLRSTPAGWKIIDIYLKGTVSELALRRSEYSAVLQRDGFDMLLRSVEGRIAELSTGTGTPGPR
jgi:phospholipid transport system substrate-binding protein